MDIIRGVCIFCTENDFVLSDSDKTVFLKLIKSIFFIGNRFNYTEFSKLFTKASVCMHCAYKIDRCSKVRDAFKKGDTHKNRKPANKCCSLCFKSEHLTNVTAQLKKEAVQFMKDVHKRGSAAIVKYVCLACSFAVSTWGTLTTGIWNILHSESADSEKENASGSGPDTVDSEPVQARSARTRGQANADKGKKDKGVPSKPVDKRKRLSVRQSNGETVRHERALNEGAGRKTRHTVAQDDVGPTKTRPVSTPDAEVKPKRARHKADESPGDAAPRQLKKRRCSDPVSPAKPKRNPRHVKHRANGALEHQLQHLRTVDHETRSTTMNLSYNAVTDQRIMFDIPYVVCAAPVATAHGDLSARDTSETEPELEHKTHRTPAMSLRQTRRRSVMKCDETVIDVSSTDDETPEASTGRRRSGRKRRLTPKAQLGTGQRHGLRSAGYRSTDAKAAGKRFRCVHCGQQFPSSYRRKLHQLEHDGESDGVSSKKRRPSEAQEAREPGSEQEDSEATESSETGVRSEETRAEVSAAMDSHEDNTVAEEDVGVPVQTVCEEENVDVEVPETQDAPGDMEEVEHKDQSTGAVAGAQASEDIDGQSGAVEQETVERATELEASDTREPETQAAGEASGTREPETQATGEVSDTQESETEAAGQESSTRESETQAAGEATDTQESETQAAGAELETQTPGDTENVTENSDETVATTEEAIVESTPMSPVAQDAPSLDQEISEPELPLTQQSNNNECPDTDEQNESSDVQEKNEHRTETPETGEEPGTAEAPASPPTLESHDRDVVSSDAVASNVPDAIPVSDEETEKNEPAQEPVVQSEEDEEMEALMVTTDSDSKTDTAANIAAAEPSPLNNGLVAKKTVPSEKSDEEFAAVEHFLENIGA